MLYEHGEILLAKMLNELQKCKDDKSKNITYWANIKSLLDEIFKIKFKAKKAPQRRDIILNALQKSQIINNKLRRDIDHLAKIRHAYGHDNSILVMSGKTEKTMKRELEKSYYVKTRSTKKTFRKYSTERKIGLLCHAIFSNLTMEYKKLVKPELFDASKYNVKINMFQY